jgi:hypothetical protein
MKTVQIELPDELYAMAEYVTDRFNAIFRTKLGPKASVDKVMERMLVLAIKGKYGRLIKRVSEDKEAFKGYVQ